MILNVLTVFYSQPLEEAKKYFKRKVDFVTKQMEKVQPVLIEKSKMRQGKKKWDETKLDKPWRFDTCYITRDRK